MKIVSINTFEEIHHVCLMYGLKKAFGRFPFLVRNVMATPPPVRRRPDRSRPLFGFRHNPVNVQYYNKEIRILFEDAGPKEITEFAKAVIEEYLKLRHPYMKTTWDGMKLKEAASDHLIAEINPEVPETDDMP